MATLSQAKTLGGVGSILLILTIAPAVGPVIGIVGFILVLVAVKYVSEVVGDRSIFSNALLAVVFGIIGLVAGLVLGAAGILSMVPGVPRLFRGPFEPEFGLQGFGLRFLAAIIVGLVIVWIFNIISAVFLRRSFKSIATSLNIGLFGTAALLYLIGAILVIVFVGFILIFVAAILQTIAFFSIPETLPSRSEGPPPPSSP